MLDYCARVAAAPDPDDPDAVLRAAEAELARGVPVDERLDPYSARWVPREARTERLAAVVRNERGVEGIVRERSWDVLRERCGTGFAGGERGWEGAFREWRRTCRGNDDDL